MADSTRCLLNSHDILPHATLVNDNSRFVKSHLTSVRRVSMYIYIPRYGRIARSRFLISIISVKRSGSHVSSCNHEFDKLAINAKKTVGTRFGFPLNVEEQCAKAEVHRCVICNLIKPTIDNRVAWGGGAASERARFQWISRRRR